MFRFQVCIANDLYTLSCIINLYMSILAQCLKAKGPDENRILYIIKILLQEVLEAFKNRRILRPRSQNNIPGDYLFMDSKNSAFVFVAFILSSKNSMASPGFNEERSLRKIQILLSSSASINKSSFRVPDLLISIAG